MDEVMVNIELARNTLAYVLVVQRFDYPSGGLRVRYGFINS